MFLRDVLKRWTTRPADAAPADDGAAADCRTAPSLLAELATDPSDFADLARVLRLDLRAVIEMLVADDAATPADLVGRLRERADAEARLTRVRALCSDVAERLGAESTTVPTATTRPATSWWVGRMGGLGAVNERTATAPS